MRFSSIARKNKTMNKKAIIDYFVIIMVVAVYTLYFDGVGGSYLLLIFSVAPIVSLVIILLGKNHLLYSLSCQERLLNKGDEMTLFFQVEKTKIFPLPLIQVFFKSDFHFVPSQYEDFEVCFGLSPAVHKYVIPYKTYAWGVGEIWVSKIIITDFLGLFSLNCPLSDGLKRKFTICPKLYQCNADSQLEKDLLDRVGYSDDLEMIEGRGVFRGTPGYEHRAYVPGDPFTQINWKLSAKKDSLYVREPELYSNPPLILVVDPYCVPSQIRNSLFEYPEQSLIEALLSFCVLLIKRDVLCCVTIYLLGEWQNIQIQGYSDVELLRVQLAEYHYIEDARQRIPEFLNENCSFLLFTTSPDQLLDNNLKGLESKGIKPIVISTDAETNMKYSTLRILFNYEEFQFSW